MSLNEEQCKLHYGHYKNLQSRKYTAMHIKVAQNFVIETIIFFIVF